MKHRCILVAVAAILGIMMIPSAAFAWSGGKVKSVSCPEIHVNLPVENGNWQVWAVEKGKTVYGPVLVPGAAFEQVVGGFWTPDNATHTGVVYAANAANASDGKVSLPYQLTRCAQPVGAQGPPGPPGQPGSPGIGYDCTGAAVPTGGTPALCPGSPGPPGKDGTCTSARVFDITIGRQFNGHDITAATITWAGGRTATATRRSDGRLRVSASFIGVVGVAGQVRVITITARLSDGDTVTLSRRIRLCLEADGNLNYPSDIPQNGHGDPDETEARRVVRINSRQKNGSRVTLARLTLRHKK